MLFLTLLLTTLLFGICHGSPTMKRATLKEVTDSGDNPAAIKMYIYVPYSVPTSPGIVASLHGASGNTQQHFIAVYPECPQGAWDATLAESIVHEGGGTSHHYCMIPVLSNTMAGAYPDVFSGAILYSAGSSKSIRNMYPSYSGSYPKIQLYLGSKDTIIGSAAFNTTLNTWASVHRYNTSPDELLANTPMPGWTTYALGSKLEGIWAEGVGHPVPTQGDEDMKWWGFA
ncbi:hypothetical protein P170DRAFT_490440 [Aspergillus steynii IBT 23096]|uniref:Carboxylic ester hydrolase n=1 Tax=Aspergillus steynii IBT 23096 TaxID=1392250 RepID=A0A2I2GKD2_9EURO|nr:uncharacterized protein P170DRAFT_490440 [Aspergillus steynii IBT 23096]PLB53336.1 hypothetical protein P170DRAFT_490440 [Aspergillus steynii IBT 23096]